MKTIILFSRCQLTDLYGRISATLSKTCNIIHVAYSNEEEDVLKTKYGINEVINFRKEVNKILSSEKQDFTLINRIDELIIKNSNNRFCINSAIQADRTFQYHCYDDCLVLVQSYYKFWDRLFKKEHVEFMLHEPTSLFLNHISALLLKNYNAKYITLFSVYGEYEHNYIIVSGDDSLFDEYINNKNNCQRKAEETIKLESFLKLFRNDSSTFLSQVSKKNKSFRKTILHSVKISFFSFINLLKTHLIKYTQLDHISFYHVKNQRFRDEICSLWSAYLVLKFDEYNPELKYYYYPIHLEPEAVVLYWGDSIYKNQVKLIENIAAQLPPNCYLYVKDHPHAGAYRDYADYKKIKAIPNVKLLNSALSGKSIIKKSIGVITINGTSGFEALLLNKQIYTFGNCFYNQCPRVNYIHNVRNLRQALYANINIIYEDDEILLNFVSTYLKSIHPGFTDYFNSYPKLLGIDEEKNAEIVAKGLVDYFKNSKSVS